MDTGTQDDSCAVLILGCGRSGTSIFGELFEHIPGYTYFSEPPFDTVIDLNFVNPIAIKVPTESSKYLAPDGLSFPIDVMLSALPLTRKIYWQVRHPLDTIASLRVGISTNWGHHPRPPDWHEWLSKSLIERCAYHWAYINSVGFKQVKHLVEISHFETMLANPAKFAHQICANIGIDPSECEPELAKWHDRVQDTNNDKFVEAKTSSFYSRNDHKAKVGRWKENLSQKEVSQAIPIIREAAAIFGYELPN